MLRTTSKFKVSMGALLALPFLFLVGCADLSDVEFQYEVHRARAHFQKNAKAFAALGEALDKAPDYQGVQICEEPDCYTSRDEPFSEEDLHFISLIEGLGFPSVNSVFFERRKDGSIWIPNMGAGLWQGGSYDGVPVAKWTKQVSLSYAYDRHRRDQSDNCVKKSKIQDEIDCAEALGDGWWLEYWGLKVEFDGDWSGLDTE